MRSGDPTAEGLKSTSSTNNAGSSGEVGMLLEKLRHAKLNSYSCHYVTTNEFWVYDQSPEAGVSFQSSPAIHKTICDALNANMSLLSHVLFESFEKPYYGGYASITLDQQTYLVSFVLSQGADWQLNVAQVAALGPRGTTIESIQPFSLPDHPGELRITGLNSSGSTFEHYLWSYYDKGSQPRFDSLENWGIHLSPTIVDDNANY